MQSPSESRRGALHAALVSVLLAMAVAFALFNHDEAASAHAAANDSVFGADAVAGHSEDP